MKYFSNTDSHSYLSRRQFLHHCIQGCTHGLAGAMLLGFLSRAIAHQPNAPSFRKNAFYWQDLIKQPLLIQHALGAPSPQSLLAPPGSIMKILVTACLLENQLLSEEETISCNGSIQIGQNRYHCKDAHGKMTLPSALGQSCNVFFAHMAGRIPLSQLGTIFNTIGWQRLQKQLRPSLSTPDAKSRLALGLDPTFAVSPQELLLLSRCLAERSAPFQEKTFHSIYQGMQLAATAGTGKHLDPENRWHLALKTGTIPRREQTHSGSAYESWITGFFPIQNPRYLFCAYSPEGSSVETLIPYVKKEFQGRNWGATWDRPVS